MAETAAVAAATITVAAVAATIPITAAAAADLLLRASQEALF